MRPNTMPRHSTLTTQVLPPKRRRKTERFAGQTFAKMKNNNTTMVSRLMSRVGNDIDEATVRNIQAYARQLLQADTDHVDKCVFTAQLYRTFGLTDHTLIERVHQVVATKVVGDHKAVSLEDMVRLVCVYVTNDLPLKVDFVFRVYNVKGSNHLSSVLTARDIYWKLKPMVQYMSIHEGPDAEEENVKDIVDLIMSMIDINNDNNIDYGEFMRTVKDHPLMLECFGPSFPPRPFLDDFKEIMKLSEFEVLAHFRNERRRCLGYPPALQSTDSVVQRYFPVTLDLP